MTIVCQPPVLGSQSDFSVILFKTALLPFTHFPINCVSVSLNPLKTPIREHSRYAHVLHIKKLKLKGIE